MLMTVTKERTNMQSHQKTCIMVYELMLPKPQITENYIICERIIALKNHTFYCTNFRWDFTYISLGAWHILYAIICYHSNNGMSVFCA